MSTSSTVLQQNSELAEKMNEEFKRNPRPADAGKFVGIANGKVLIITDSLKELGRCLRQAEPDPAKTFVFELGRDYSKVYEI